MCVFPYSLSQIEYFRRSFRLLLVPGNSLLTPKIPKVEKIALLFVKGGLKKRGTYPISGRGVDPPSSRFKKSTFFKQNGKNIQHSLTIYLLLLSFFCIVHFWVTPSLSAGSNEIQFFFFFFLSIFLYASPIKVKNLLY